MAKFEISKSVEGVKVNKRSGIPTSERISLAFGAIIEDPVEERDCLRFKYLLDIVDVKLSDIEGCYKPIGSGSPSPAQPAPPPGPALQENSAPAAGISPADPRYLQWENIPSNLTTRRARVPGGWLVAVGHGLAFLPDPAHAWDGSSVEVAD